jgi:hypothetical protein
MRSGFYVGHGSWAVAAFFLLTIALRIGFGNRRRQGRPRPPVHAPGFQADQRASGVPPTAPPPATSSPPPPATSSPSGVPSQPAAHPARRGAGIGSTGIAAGWLVDPTGRHELRYWSGTAWTEHVSDGGAPAIDDPPTT